MAVQLFFWCLATCLLTNFLPHYLTAQQTENNIFGRFFFLNHQTLYLEVLKGCFNYTHKLVYPVEQLIPICELLI